MENESKKQDITKIDPSKVRIIKDASLIKPLGELDTAIDPSTGLEVNIKDVRERVDVARGNVHSANPCFGALLEYVNFIYTFDVPTQATDGTRIFINPVWTGTLTDGEIRFVMIHELLHCVFNHLQRGQGHDRRIANIAGDYEVNGAAFLDKFVNQGQLDHVGGYYSEKYTKHPNTNDTDLWSYEMIYQDVLQHPDNFHKCPELDIIWGEGGGSDEVELMPSSPEFKRGFADAMHKINGILEKNYRKMSKRLGESYTNDDVAVSLSKAMREIDKIRKVRLNENNVSKMFKYGKEASGIIDSIFKKMGGGISKIASKASDAVKGIFGKRNGAEDAGGLPDGMMGFSIFEKERKENSAENDNKLIGTLHGLLENAGDMDENEISISLSSALHEHGQMYDDFNPLKDIDDQYKTYDQGWDYAVNESLMQISSLLSKIANPSSDSQQGGGCKMKAKKPAIPSDCEHLNIPTPPHFDLYLNKGKGGTGDKTKHLSNEDIISQQEGANIARKAGYKGEFTKEEELDEIRSKWEEITSHMAGKEGSELITRHIKNIEASKYNWQHELRKLMNRAMSNSLKFRNEWGEKRGLARDTMTLKHKTNNDAIKDVVFLVDCSGSISDKTLSNLLSECYAITKKCNVYDVTYAYFTTRVELVETTNTRLAGKISDAAVMLLKRCDKHAKGGHITGGTDFKNALDWVSENGGARCVVMFTDGYDEVVPKPHNVKNLIWGVYDNPDFKSADNSRVVYLTTKNE